MKRVRSLALLLAVLLVLGGCGKSEATAAADKLIEAIGEVTLESGESIDAAEKAVKALTGEELEKLDNGAALKEKRALYTELVKAEEERLAAEAEAARVEAVKAEAAELDAQIKSIGEVTEESEAAIVELRAAYDAADAELQGYVTALAELEAAEAKLAELKAQPVIALIDAIGEVTLANAAAVDAAEEAYAALNEGQKACVTNSAVLAAAKTAMEELRRADAEAKLARMTKEEDVVRGMRFYYPSVFPYYANLHYWGADIRCFALPYMGIQGDDVWLRFVCNYTNDDWVFFKKITFAVDDQRYYKTFSYNSVERDNAWGKVWEYVDLDVGATEIEIMEAIVESENTIIRFEGDTYWFDFTVTANDKKAIREMLDIYNTLK